MTALILFGVFFVCLILGVPIAVGLGIATLLALFQAGVPASVLPQRMFLAVDSFPFMAIPFFMLAGSIMEKGGISRRLVDFANELLGPIRGGLAMATSLACAFFAALSGSGPGTVAAIGSVMYPQMVKQEYDPGFAAGLIAAAGGLGPIIPPSILMVTFGVVTESSIGDLFLGGVGVGVVLLICLLGITYLLSVKAGYRGARDSWSGQRIVQSFWSALPALGMPALILGGIYGGFFTPTEAAAVSVVYALVVSLCVYREVKLQDLVEGINNAAVAASVVLFIMGTSAGFSWLFAWSGSSRELARFIITTFPSPLVYVIATTIVMLIFGTFMEGNAILLLLMPILYPPAKAMGIDPIYYGLVATLAMVIGLITPPVAVNIYTAQGVTGLPMERVVKGMMPFFIAMLVGLVILIFVPQTATFIPSMLKAR
ncbi:TRAP transporter large permease [Gelria sp. Kuro-4]|uniref:TRAP transporter large permease n=1 Tax=Gelria sp. Kuro-4 TaxID=2796927 RepID=UPI001BEF52CB|nr:TRAP transporter large permease [Gelria sp. Kuro-4]BCV23245.1 hypothetical protein kuro4_00180 [Gelria sp. Kuro-4]